MSTIHLNLPSGAVIKGTLQTEYQIEDLDQEILEVDLPDGETIDVGWYPQFDRNGSFQIVVYRDYWENRKNGPVFVRTPDQVAWLVQMLAEFYSRPQAIPVSDSRVGVTESRITDRQSRKYAYA